MKVGSNLLVMMAMMVGVLAAAVAYAPRAYSDIEMTTKRLLIIRPGIESLWGSYIFAIGNTGTEQAEIETSFSLPKETNDWMPQEGALPKDIRLGESGDLILKATYPPGVHMISIGFRIDTGGSESPMTIQPAMELSEFTLLYPETSGLGVQAPGLVDGGLDGNGQEQYHALKSSGPMPKGQSFVISVSNIPEDRTKPYLLGGLFAGLFLIGGIIMAIKTRPKSLEEHDDLSLQAS